MILSPPFSYHGSKRRQAAEIALRLGDTTVYAEPFAGSLAALLLKEPCEREVVCDKNGLIVNFWRALRNDPHEVAYWADYPTFHDDLTARHTWLIKWVQANANRLVHDADWSDPQAAGWWVWGISNWIGGGFCSAIMWTDDDSAYQYVSNNGGNEIIVPHNKIPLMGATHGGRGVQVQRTQIPAIAGTAVGGRGVQAQRKSLSQTIGGGSRLIDWFEMLAQRLSHVIVLNRDWKSAVTPTVLLQHGRKKDTVGVLLDPPYLLDERTSSTVLYNSDVDTNSDHAAVEAYRWAIEHGEEYKIAYCAHLGDFPLPDGWTSNNPVKLRIGKRLEVIYYSPACFTNNTDKQLELL